MLSFTLDTNCICAVDEARPEASFVLQLADAHREGLASVALVAISASEKQKALRAITSFTEFQLRLEQLGLGHLDIVEPMKYWDVTFWDHDLWADESMCALEQQIQRILFPNIEVERQNYCAARGLDVDMAHADQKWRNSKCDVQAFWSHAYRQRHVFVTSDKNFHAKAKKGSLLALAGAIETPESAARMLRYPNEV